MTFLSYYRNFFFGKFIRLQTNFLRVAKYFSSTLKQSTIYESLKKKLSGRSFLPGVPANNSD